MKASAIRAHASRDVIVAAKYADAISDEGIDRYLRAGLMNRSSSEDGVTERSARLRPT
jgi:hypothetical protein